MLGFLILDIVVALNGHCLWSWNYSAHALHYAILFFEKKLFLLGCFLLLNMGYLWILGSQWLIQVHGCSYLQDYLQDHSVTVSQTKNDYIYLYLVMMKVKKNFFIWNDYEWIDQQGPGWYLCEMSEVGSGV